jgi:hypothetical protein
MMAALISPRRTLYLDCYGTGVNCKQGGILGKILTILTYTCYFLLFRGTIKTEHINAWKTPHA